MALQVNYVDPSMGVTCAYHTVSSVHVDAANGNTIITVKSFATSVASKAYPKAVTVRDYTISSIPTSDPVAWAYTQLQLLSDFKGATTVA
jgi:hypothetical protein